MSDQLPSERMTLELIDGLISLHRDLAVQDDRLADNDLYLAEIRLQSLKRQIDFERAKRLMKRTLKADLEHGGPNGDCPRDT